MHREAMAEASDPVRLNVGQVRRKICLQHDGKHKVLASKLPKDSAGLALMAVLHSGETCYGWELDFDGPETMSTDGVD